MKSILLYFFLAITCLGCEENKKVINVENDKPTGTIKPDIFPASPDSLPLKDSLDANDEIIRPGVHNLTIQWISWNEPGKATITKDTAGWYTIKGSQENRDGDYLRIDGKLKPFDKNELLFNGTITYKVSSINNSIPCIKEGDQVFLSTKGRKYWRLQNMTSCEGGTTDYIDIYF